MKVLMVPLDDRPCNYKYPQMIANSNQQIEYQMLPFNFVGYKKERANTDEISNWLRRESGNVNALVCSLDMLLYGGLIPSRLHNDSIETICERLGVLKELKEANPSLKIYAQCSIMRTPKYNSSDEEPDYYEQYGEAIFWKRYLEDKQSRDGLDATELEKLKSIVLPTEIETDYRERRETNMAVIMKIIDYVVGDVIDFISIGQDDSAEYGYTAIDQQQVKEQIKGLNLDQRIYIYPGADEVIMSLLARAYLEYIDRDYTVNVTYSSTLGPSLTPMYEDRPFFESLKSHVDVTGGLVVGEQADYSLFVNTPGKVMQESWDQLEKIDQTYNSHRNLKHFCKLIKRDIELGRKVIIADVAFANGSDIELVKYLIAENLLDKCYGYAGWNTHCNTLGTVISQAVIAPEVTGVVRYNNLYHVLEDCIYQSIVRMNVTNSKLDSLGLNYFDLKQNQNEVAAIEVEMFKKEMTSLKVSGVKNLKIKHPWNRMFECDLEFEVDENER